VTTAAEIARALGGAQRSGEWWRAVCPVHGSRTGSSATLALHDGDWGLIAVCHAGCDRADIVAALRRCGVLGEGRVHLRRKPVTVRRDSDREGAARRTAVAQRIWDAARDASRTAVVNYLAGRGVQIPLPSSLRWATALRRPDGGSGPAMVARVDDVNGRLIAIHRTWLNRDPAGQWRRRDRASLGPISGGAVRLAPAAEVLMVSEGVETAASAMQAVQLPVWAALSASGLVAVVLPPIVRSVIILADHDASGAGERAARVAAARWVDEGRRVRIALPPEPGLDFNDVLCGRGSASTQEADDVIS
jgi:putative DNA primase/helicase